MVRGLKFTSIAKGRYAFLLVCILLLFVLYPFTSGDVFGIGVLDVLTTLILLVATYILGRKGHRVAVVVLLAIPAVVVGWLTYAIRSQMINAVADVLSILFFTTITLMILADVLKDERITGEKIYGAICAYLLMGLIWSFSYDLLETLHKESFSIVRAADKVGLQRTENFGADSDLAYYSFITLTTLGYGDICPRTATARSLASLEALVGQLYLAVLVSRLVGLHIAYSAERWAMRQSGNDGLNDEI
jgi:hypothetical protein